VHAALRCAHLLLGLPARAAARVGALLGAAEGDGDALLLRRLGRALLLLLLGHHLVELGGEVWGEMQA